MRLWPWLQRRRIVVEVPTIGPGDKVILQADRALQADELAQIKTQWRESLSGQGRCLVLSGGLRLVAVIKPGGEVRQCQPT